MENLKITAIDDPGELPLKGKVRQPILKLASMVTNRLFYKMKPEDPEYWGLAVLISDEEAELALKMKRRVPRTMAALKKLSGKTEAELMPMLDHMSEVGVLEYNWENPQHEKQWSLPMFVPGSGEFTNMNADVLREHPEVARFFERMTFLPLASVTPMVPPGGAGVGMHVIPVEKAIGTENQSIDIEHISHWLDKYDGKYAASPCSCRRCHEVLGDGCADDTNDWCIAVGDMADYVVETNKGGRYISREEALAIFRKAEDNGFVHQITNIDGEDKIFAICNCNVNVCNALRTSQLFNTPNLSRSAYVARVTPEDCVACGRCVEYCPAGAVKLGQKLCTKDGPVEYPKHPLPDAKKWGPDDWTVDYRDKNRINCYDTGTAPCKTACPAHIAVQGYLKKAAQGKYTEALELIKKENPFPAVCGAICNRRCEEACTRATLDQAVAIDEVKKFIAAQDLNAETRFIPAVVQPSLQGPYTEKIAIIGGGPAGLSCAYYLAEKGYRPTVFEKESRPGGMLMNGIPSFRLEKDVVDAEIDIIRQMGVEIRCGVEVGKNVTFEALRGEGYKAFYIAIGCQGGRGVGVPGEDAAGVETGVAFLRRVNIDPAGTKLSGDTVVIGGGNVAVDVARAAERCGDGRVRMFCLEDRASMPAADDEVAEAEREGISVSCGWGPKEVLSENGRVKAVVFKKCTRVFDEKHKFAPLYDENDTQTVACENLLLSVGQSILWGDLLKGSRVKLGRGNGALADALTYQTAEPDIFVGGDVYSGPAFAIDAIAAGKEGAVSIHRFVHPNCSLTIGRNRREFVALDKQNIAVGSYDTTPRQIPGVRAEGESAKSFHDNRLPFTEEQVRAETARCLGCGASVVDPNKCIGCGVCTTKCAFDAIKLYRERPACSKMVVSEDKVKALLPYMAKRQIKILLKKDK